VGNGNLTPAEAKKIHAILQTHRNNVQDREFEARLAEMEKNAPPNRPCLKSKRHVVLKMF
jgi:hypothetical protein